MGRFPHTSSQGNKYIMVLYHYAFNAILATPMKNQLNNTIIETYRKMLQPLLLAGFKPDLHMMGNKMSKQVQQFFDSAGISYQLAPPHIHRCNAAKRAIRTFKNHFIAGLASTDKTFPIYLLDRLVQQAVFTLNLLCRSRCNPNLSTHAQLFGQFDFNATPLAPPGTKIIVHKKPSQRRTWDPHGVDCWFFGRALKQYYVTEPT